LANVVLRRSRARGVADLASRFSVEKAAGSMAHPAKTIVLWWKMNQSSDLWR
jgi:hypothetical protein